MKTKFVLYFQEYTLKVKYKTNPRFVNQVLATSLGFRIPTVTLIACKGSEGKIVPSHSLCKITTDECTSTGNKI